MTLRQLLMMDLAGLFPNHALCLSRQNLFLMVKIYFGSLQIQRGLSSNSVFWDFGDGNFSSDLYALHTYDDNGPFTLCLHSTYFNTTGGACTGIFCMEVDETLLGRSDGFSVIVGNPVALSDINQFQDR